MVCRGSLLLSSLGGAQRNAHICLAQGYGRAFKTGDNMPSKAYRLCTYPGCPELTHGRYCPEHRYIGEQEEQERIRRLKRNDKHWGKTAERGYDADWRKLRMAYLKRHPLCERCEEQGRVEPAVLVHHIVPISAGGKALDKHNLMALCRECHGIVHSK